MAESEPDKWTPDKPIPDEDAEKESQEVARRRARADYLYQEYTKPKEAPKKKRFLDV